MPALLPQYRIISIGTLESHALWHESAAVRTGHATTTLITVGEEHIIVNPALPAQALAARLSERTSVPVDDIETVFLTSFQPDHRRGLKLFEGSRWLLSEAEKRSASAALHDARSEAEEAGDDELIGHYERELALLERCNVADDTLVAKVDLFPLPGVTEGTCGLLLALPARTVLITGDAVATIEHIEQGKVLAHVGNLAQAQESFKEAIEIADVIIPGRDNIMLNPLRRG